MTGTVTPEVRMAHEIARQFAAEPNGGSGGMIAAHLRRFWAPAMITALIEEADRGADMDPLVSAAVEELR